MDESSAEQQVCVSASITFVVRENWAYPPSASGSYRREGGSETKYGWISSFKILDYSTFCLNNGGTVL